MRSVIVTLQFLFWAYHRSSVVYGTILGQKDIANFHAKQTKESHVTREFALQLVWLTLIGILRDLLQDLLTAAAAVAVEAAETGNGKHAPPLWGCVSVTFFIFTRN